MLATAGPSPGVEGRLWPPPRSQDSVPRLGASPTPAWRCSDPSPRPTDSPAPPPPHTAIASQKTLQTPDVKWFGTKREEEATASPKCLCPCRRLLLLWFNDSVVGKESRMSLCPQRESFKFAQPPSQSAGVQRFSGPNDLPQYRCYCFNIMKNAETSRAYNSPHHSSFQAVQVYLVNG